MRKLTSVGDPCVTAVDQSNSCRTPKHTVSLRSERTHRVEVVHDSGSQAVDELTASFATEMCAALVQRTIVRCLDAGMSVEQTRDELVDRLQYEFANEVRASYRDDAYVADLDRAIDVFTPAATRERLDAMAAELRATLTGVAR